MDLLIMARFDAKEFVPEVPTYAIRIFSSEDTDHDKRPLKQSQLYKSIQEYVFDDNDTHPFRIESGPVWFNEVLAERIIRDFLEYKSEVESLLVHCGRGENRSPAVAIALNEIFGLGNNTEDLLKRYKDYNHFVYDTLLEVARKPDLI